MDVVIKSKAHVDLDLRLAAYFWHWDSSGNAERSVV